MRPTREHTQIQVGAFVAVGLFLFMLVVFLLGSEKNIFERRYHLVCRFTNISGLRVGAPVQLAGINVGTLSDIQFDETLEAKKVKLVLNIGKSYQERIREDSVASIVTQGLLGDRMIFVSVGSPDRAVLKNGGELQSKSPADFSQLLQGGEDLIESLNKITDHVDDILSKVKEGKGLLHELIYSPKGKEIMADATSIAHNLNIASGQVAQVSGKINNGQGTLGALINDATLFNDLKTLLGKANRNKLIRAVVRYTLKTKDEKLLEKE